MMNHPLLPALLTAGIIAPQAAQAGSHKVKATPDRPNIIFPAYFIPSAKSL